MHHQSNGSANWFTRRILFRYLRAHSKFPNLHNLIGTVPQLLNLLLSNVSRKRRLFLTFCDSRSLSHVSKYIDRSSSFKCVWNKLNPIQVSALDREFILESLMYPVCRVFDIKACVVKSKPPARIYRDKAQNDDSVWKSVE